MGSSITAEVRVSYSVRNRTKQKLLAGRVYAAGTSRERRVGLRTTPFLESGTGLWIAPCEAVHTFGMRFAIDLLFLDSHYRVKRLQPGLVPRRIAACFTAHSVLELGERSILPAIVEVGDQLEFVKNVPT